MKHIWKKCLPEYYQAVRKRTKTFEIRKDDSDYEVGDILELQEWDGKEYTGHKISREITYILRDCPEYGLAEGFCILAIQPIGWNEDYSDKLIGECLVDEFMDKRPKDCPIVDGEFPKFCRYCGQAVKLE